MIYYGWYEFDDKNWILTNYKSNQSISLIRKERKPFNKPKHFNSSYFEEFTFEYKDNEIRYIIIIYKFLSSEDEDKRLSSEHYRFELEIDHIKSAEIWKQSNNTNSSPPYGLWKRIDDFIVDAALCFPEKIIDGNFMSLNVIGGWHKGKWSENLKRVYSGRTNNVDKRIANYPIAEPYIEPLDSPIPQKWNYVDVEHPALKANLEGIIKSNKGFLYLPADAPLRGFEEMPHLMREDGKAVIFPAEVEFHMNRGEDYMPLPWYSYVDEDVFFTFRSHPSPSHYLELSYCRNYGYRSLTPSENILCADVYGVPCKDFKEYKRYGGYLPYYIWRRLEGVILNNWDEWSYGKSYYKKPDFKKILLNTIDSICGKDIVAFNSFRKLSDGTNNEGISIGSYGPAISHGFEGGITNIWFTRRLYSFESLKH